MTCRTTALRFACLVALGLTVVSTVPAQEMQPAAASTAAAASTVNTARESAPTSELDSADVLFAKWDTNHDGALSPVEFRTAWDELQAAVAMQRLHAQFIMLDTDKNGCLNAEEYAHMALVVRAGKAAPPMSRFDEQRNQCLDFKEYVVVVRTLLTQEKK